jgi:hypothetical protein
MRWDPEACRLRGHVRGGEIGCIVQPRICSEQIYPKELVTTRRAASCKVWENSDRFLEGEDFVVCKRILDDPMTSIDREEFSIKAFAIAI